MQDSPNIMPFEQFLLTLKPTNRNLRFYVDWEKCLRKRDEISISLNHLNFLLGKPQSEMLQCIERLFKEYSKAFSILHILIAVRDECELLLDSFSNQSEMNLYFTNPQKIYEFICESGLIDIFCDKKIKDLNDFVFGIEVGFDTNARKNRSGNLMESTLRQIFTQSHLDFREQVNVAEFEELHKIFGDDIKKFDFVIFTQEKRYCIECNFYASSGSKLNETARSYQEITPKFTSLTQYEFIWITDGQGWLSAKNKLQEAYKSVEIYNLSNIDDLIRKIKNDT
ncbi:restriction endonuclease [Helicobacter didelphidarum]|uniref:Type-2 restriction enzyme n=1 Tax=Helicobacter didelphidarum TaxID=2040648 RepID=A0A3D8IM14_9HELI|nr:type II restriction endonuclease [Helicobacter didelphidarum]RDU65995.1 restriction endonuclease [Helicobacter didelphidarum]